jgi:hypothetical protein
VYYSHLDCLNFEVAIHALVFTVYETWKRNAIGGFLWQDSSGNLGLPMKVDNLYRRDTFLFSLSLERINSFDL